MKDEVKLAMLIVVFAFIVVMMLVGKNCKAECTVNWKKGDVTYVEPGRPITYIIEQEDLEAFNNQPKRLPDSLRALSITPTDSVDKQLQTTKQTHLCGEYRDLTDEDVD